MAKKYKAILFDLDGTLVDTSPGIYNGVDYMLEHIGHEPVGEEIKYHLVGPPLSVTYPKYFGLEGKELENAIKIYREYNNKEGYKEIEHYPGMKELLDYLKDRGFLLGVVTMKEHGVTLVTMKETGFFDYFDVILGNEDINSYSKAELIQMAMKKLNVKNSDTLLIGDTGIDAEGAQEAEVDFFPAMYGFGFQHEDVTEDYPYIQKIYFPTDLINFLEKEAKNGTC